MNDRAERVIALSDQVRNDLLAAAALLNRVLAQIDAARLEDTEEGTRDAGR